MSDNSAELPEPHRVISMTRFDDPVSQITDTEAWQARSAYPDILGRGPMFAVTEQEPDGRWRVLTAGEGNPQGCRDSLGRQCRVRAAAAAEEGDATAEREWRAAAERMDWEKLNELTVRDCRFRIARGDMFLRTGPDGPEPPRPSDPDPMPAGSGHRAPSRTRGFLLDPAAATGVSEGILKFDLLSFVYPASLVPPDVRADSLRARRTHPGGVLLPPVFLITERTRHGWAPMTGAAETPQAARDTLMSHLRDFAPRLERLDEETAARFAEAAERLERERLDEVEAAGRRYRVARLERLVRIGPDGPEPSRPSEYDPELPAAVQTEEDRANGIVCDDS